MKRRSQWVYRDGQLKRLAEERNSRPKFSPVYRPAGLRAPHRFTGLALQVGMGVLLLGITFLAFARHGQVTRKVDYQPCQIEYGQVVAEWDGGGSDAWNEQDYHYQTKRFYLRAAAAGSWFANVAEAEPAAITTGSLKSKLEGCHPDISDLVNTNTEAYKWWGAKAVAARLGTPDLGNQNRQGKSLVESQPVAFDSVFSPPLFSGPADRAAAWVDDGGQAVIETQGRSRHYLLWCHGSDLLLKDPSCQNVEADDEHSEPRRGAGYLFTADNCPEGRDCQTGASWYKLAKASRSVGLTNTIGRNQRGELKPFYLHLGARSTFAPRVGTWVNLTFKYPRRPEIINAVSTQPTTLSKEQIFKATLTLNKIGPDLSDVVITPELEGLSLTQTQGFKLTPAKLSRLNQDRQVAVTAAFKVTASGAGQCYNLPVSTAAKTLVSGEVVKPSPASARFCVDIPGFKTAYTYTVTSRGNIKSNLDEFARQAAETYAHARGWLRAGVRLKRVAAAGDFTLVLASSQAMSSFSEGCDGIYSCQAGRYVIINDERWRKATKPWNNSGGSLRNYRHMAVNHETGHWLGFGHLSCPKAGAPAPLMQQQSVSLQGCKFNPWPTTAEINNLKTRL